MIPSSVSLIMCPSTMTLDAVAGAKDAVKVMSDHDYGKLQLLLQVQQQLIERGRADRIKTRGGLIEKQEFRIERQSARQGCALDHAP